ncbi:MAG: hypothetical protein ABI560_08035 [Myxococcales bacterium]
MLCLLLGGSAVRAAEQSAAVSRGRVVVLRPTTVDELTGTALARITGELTAARFEVTVAPLDTSRDPTPQVETIARDLEPVAAFAIAHPSGATDDTIAIWVCDRPGRRITIQRMTMHGDNISQDAEVLALEAIELIRVSIAGLWPAHNRELDAQGPPVPLFPARHNPELSLGVGVTMLVDTAISSAAWMGYLQAMLKWSRGMSVHAEVRGLGSSVTVPGSYGSAAVQRTSTTAGIGWVFWSAERVRSMLLVGLGLEHLSASGTAPDTARLRTESSWTTLVTAGVGLSARLNSVLAFGLQVDGVLTVPPINLRIGDTETKQLSQPGLMLTAAVQARF